MTSFSLAVNRTWKNAQGEPQEDVGYFDCTAWGKAGEIIAQYNKKGSAILVSGRLNHSTWEQDGNKRSKVDVVVEDFNFVGGGGGGDGGSSTSRSSSSSSSSSSAPAKKPKADDVVIADIPDGEIDLSDIPF